MEEFIEPQLVIKPKFNALCILIDKYLFTTLAIIILLSITYSKQFLLMYVIIAIAYIAYIAISLLLINRKYKKTEYVFYDYKIAIKEKSKETEIAYNEIKDFLLYQSSTQKMFNFGEITIKLKEDNILSKGIQLKGISNIDKAVAQIKHIVYDN